MPELTMPVTGAATAGRGTSPFPAIGDYAFLSDCATTALIAPDGAVEWMSLPRADSPSVFGTLLDRSAGFFRLGPAHQQVPVQRRYVPGSLVLETTWSTPSGWMIVRDALVMGPWTGDARVPGHRRPPGDSAARGMLVRTATCISGQVDLALDCLPLFDYGRIAGPWSYTGPGYGAAACAPEGHPALTLTSSLRLGLSGARATARARLHEGQTAFVALTWDVATLDVTGADGGGAAAVAVAQIDATVEGWRDWLRHARLPDHPWRPYLERSALTLKGLSYAPSGAIMAAATTSLPETPGGERNWDYRFTWVRDSAFLLSALFQLGFDQEAFAYFAFLMDAVASGPLQIMYGIDAERELGEQTLDHLSGYDGARPVRTGNGAYDQHQHDVWGMAMESICLHFAKASEIGPVAWQMVVWLVDSALAAWREPDRGIWEVRGEPRHFTASKVMCWVAADRGARLAAVRGAAKLAATWQAAAAEIRADIEENGVDDRGVFVQHYGSAELDASALLIPLMGFLPPDDKRVRATVLAIADELTSDGLVLRYRPAATDDGLAGDEGTFTICSFWLVSALTMIGEVDRATALCTRLLSLASPLLLYAEEIDAVSGRHLGNFPQAFTHLALIDAVLRVIAAGGCVG
jgi:alpha,alpha-trehalase